MLPDFRVADTLGATQRRENTSESLLPHIFDGLRSAQSGAQLELDQFSEVSDKMKVLFLTAIEGSRERAPLNDCPSGPIVSAKKPARVRVGERQIAGMTLREVVVKGDREL